MKLEMEYHGWQIYTVSQKNAKGFTIFIAIKPNHHPIEGIDLPDLKADIDETEIIKPLPDLPTRAIYGINPAKNTEIK